MMLLIRQTDTYRKWESKLADHRARAMIAARISRLAFGLAGDVKTLGDGVCEIRIHHGPGYRVYFTKRGNEILVLLCGGDKGTQKRDILRAKALLATLDDDHD